MSTHDDPDWPAEPPKDLGMAEGYEDDPEEQFLAQIRGERDLKKLRQSAATTFVPEVLAVLANPNADASVLEAIALGHNVVEHALLDDPRCPSTVLDQLMSSEWTDVRDRARTIFRASQFPGLKSPGNASRQPAEPVMKKLARDEERRRTSVPSRPWTSRPHVAEDFSYWLDDDDVRPHLDEDMPAAIYDMAPTYEEAFFDLSEPGTAAYMTADPVDDGPEPTYLLERVVARHPRCSKLLVDRVGARLVQDVALLKPIEFDGALRTPLRGKPQSIPDAIPALAKAIRAMVEHPDLDKAHLKALVASEVPEIRNLVALSPRAHVTDLRKLATSVTALPLLAVHPSKKVRELQTVLLKPPHDHASGRDSTLLLRGILATNPHISDWAVSDIKASGSQQELIGLAANTNLDMKTLLFLAEEHHDPAVHEALAMNHVAPEDVLAKWADHAEPAMRALVARNPGLPQEAVKRLVDVEAEPRVLDALAGNPRLPVEAIRTLFNRGYVPELALNTQLPPDLQENIADGPDPQARYHLARNPKTAAHLLWRLVDPELRVWYLMSGAERSNQCRIERAVATHPNAPMEALRYLETSIDPRTRIAAKVALHATTTTT